MTLLPIPSFSDNYIWMVHDGRRALVVDPGEEGPVIEMLERAGLELQAILVTHHHADHVGGIAGLRSRLRGSVFGPAGESIPAPCEPTAAPEVVQALGLRFQVLDIPGHTAGHIAYYCEDLAGAPVVFCGDTLFSAGCGRLFEGTAAQMHHSLGLLTQLPGSTRVCCAHEYTLSNLRFALAVEPGNRALQAYTQWCQAQRENNLPTLPSTLQNELEVNPFLRCTVPDVREAAAREGCASSDPVAVLATLREWKNRFR